MAKITLPEITYDVLPEGRYTFNIVDVTYKEDYGKLDIKMKTENGEVHIEKYNLIKKDGNPNDGAYKALGFFAKTVLNDFTINEIDHTDLIGHSFIADIEHDVQQSSTDPKKTLTFAHLKNITTLLTESKPAEKQYDLDDIFS